MRHPRLVLTVLLQVLLWGGTSHSAPQAERWPLWDTSQPESTTRVDHAAWDRFLGSYVVADHPSGINRVRYADVTAADRKALKTYLAQLQAIKVRGLNRAEQKAYWINLYNALTVDVMLDHYPVASIMEVNISPGLLSRGPWGKKLVTVEGQELALDDIEHRILRPIWKDPRAHYAVNCASLGCPNLQPKAFTADNTDALLDQAARAYVNHPRGVTVKDGKVMVSSIYIWFQSDFGGDDAGLLTHLRRYADEGLRRQLDGATRISDHSYDWKLNSP
ncbi:MAG: DUF547 domain-containing protein [Nitrospirota bacterium]